MTYEEILSQVARRLGHQGYGGELRNDYRFAIKWAEDELMSFATPTRVTVTEPLNDEQAEYDLKGDWGIEDFGRPFELQFYDENDNQLAYEEVTYDQWLRWNPDTTSSINKNDIIDEYGVTPEATADEYRFSNKLLVCVHYATGDTILQSDYRLSVKPAINGTVILNYGPSAVEDIFENLTRSPRFPQQFHHYLISGAVYYLSQIESAQSEAKGDAQRASFFQRLQSTSFAEWEKRKNKVSEQAPSRTNVVSARPFTWYDRGTKYR